MRALRTSSSFRSPVHFYRQRQLQRKGRSFADEALDADPALVLLDDLSADRQAEAGAAAAVLVRLLGRVERLEDKTQALGLNADAGVDDADLGHLRLGVLAHLDRQA